MKPHYSILDGLRGVAALVVVAFHLLEAYFPEFGQTPIHHGYLAVDFFFMLSGFVVGYAYDDRWQSIGAWGFLQRRLVRLHPLVVLSVLVGSLFVWFSPYGAAGQHTSLVKLLVTMLVSFTLLPSPDVRGEHETHSLNGPLWSLLQEYLANVLYALVGRLGLRWLRQLVLGCAGALAWMALARGDVAIGWSYSTLGLGTVRMLYPFFAGLLLFRLGWRVRLPLAFPLCSVGLITVFCLPHFRYNGLYEATCIILVFPLLIAAAARRQVSDLEAKICRFFGDLSYPLYVLHYPFVSSYTAWLNAHKPPLPQALFVAGELVVGLLILAYAALKLYDEPVRSWLQQKVFPKTSKVRKALAVSS